MISAMLCIVGTISPEGVSRGSTGIIEIYIMIIVDNILVFRS